MLSYSAGIVLIACAALGGYAVSSLTKSGSIAAFAVGTVLFIGYQWNGLVILGLFFVSSSLWSKYKKQKKKSLDRMLEKGDRRDWVQVLANGSIAAVGALWFAFNPSEAATVFFLASVAAANSDTWGSEIGVLSRGKPFHLLKGKRVEKGTSGAVSLLGTIASFGGALVISLAGWLLLPGIGLAETAIILCSGFMGSVIDTLLGGSIQAKYKCPACSEVTEKREHCGNSTNLANGYRWCNNDVVNILSILLSAMLAILFLNLR
ncbi:DUF92 domain-containing protein [Bacillus testis]|uniref:DUF92 domain-containing protein n=1 Tax=Bacillus testis TaxID=1622072 RepID=UPI00067EDCDA|nr:DUF92 domain-containing protein [Bacillus testis]